MSDIVVANFTDDNNSYISAKNTKSLVKSLERTGFSKGFQTTNLKVNGDKCHILLSTSEKVVTNVDSAQIEKSHSKKF